MGEVYNLEYVWLDSQQNARSKTKVIKKSGLETPTNHNILPIWNYDGSSTGQAQTEKSEILLKPVKVVKDPFRTENSDSSYLVLCETLNPDGTPNEYNTRSKANSIFAKRPEDKPMFGLEQEFFLSSFDNEGNILPIGFTIELPVKEQGDYYCGVGFNNVFGREMIEEALVNLNYSGINITGLNAEVAPSQWEFQVCSTGIDAADDLILMRYICNRTFENHNCLMDLTPKYLEEFNGSGCHVNFSTEAMRNENGYEEIVKAIQNLKYSHALHIKHYGEGNETRLTGKHETSSMVDFTSGVGSRNTSIRIPNDTYKNKCGYFEDRRPCSTLDPYVVTSLLYATSCNIEQNVFV